jgi:quinol monooxygenase YgiN
MEFIPEKVDEFLEVFHASKHLIRQFPGVLHLELHRDADQPAVFYTYSHWESADDLEAYRISELFQSVWSQTKVLFAGKPQAFSLVQQWQSS